jgi:hypothetical protein
MGEQAGGMTLGELTRGVGMKHILTEPGMETKRREETRNEKLMII